MIMGKEQEWIPLDRLNNNEPKGRGNAFWVDSNKKAQHELMAMRDGKTGILKVDMLINDKPYCGQLIGWALDYPHIRVDELNQSFEFAWATILRAIKDKKRLRA